MTKNGAARPSTIIVLCCWLLLSVFSSDAHLIMNLETNNEFFIQEKFPSVAYFRFHFMEVDEYDNGRLYQYRSDGNYTAVNDPHDFFGDRAAPKVVLVNISTLEALYEQQQQQGESSLLQCDYIVMILDECRTWTSRLRFWWSHSLPLSIPLSMSKETAPPRYLAVTWNVGQSKSF
jgi:hypothetical protein